MPYLWDMLNRPDLLPQVASKSYRILLSPLTYVHVGKATASLVTAPRQ
jgi:hypothetical protein